MQLKCALAVVFEHRRRFEPFLVQLGGRIEATSTLYHPWPRMLQDNADFFSD